MGDFVLRAARASLTIFLLVLVAASGWGFWREYRAFLGMQGYPAQRIDSFVAVMDGTGTSPPLPLSNRARRAMALDCAENLLWTPVLKSDAALRDRYRRACAALSDRLLAAAPGLPVARALKVVLSGSAEDYRLAQSAAPHEPATISLRLLALRGGEGAEAAVQALLAADVDAALAFPSTRQALARLYVDNPALKPVIEARLASASARDQDNFVSEVRRVMRGVSFDG